MDQVQSVACWRGECLNYFARAEFSVGQCLEIAISSGKFTKLRHLAGQRLADLLVLSESIDGTTKQVRALANALEAWKRVEERRQFLAHGVVQVSISDKGTWVALLDLVNYRANTPNPERWAVTQEEAKQFLEELASAFKDLTSQLGQFRKRLAA